MQIAVFVNTMEQETVNRSEQLVSPILELHIPGPIIDFKDDGDKFDGKYIPARILPVLIGKENLSTKRLVVLPESVRSYVEGFWEILSEINGEETVFPFKIFYVPYYPYRDSTYYTLENFLMTVLPEEFLGVIRGLVPRGKVRLYPYMTTRATLALKRFLEDQGFSVENGLPFVDTNDPLYPTRSSGRRLGSFDPKLAEKIGFNYPPSWYCVDKDEIDLFIELSLKNYPQGLWLKVFGGAGGYQNFHITCDMSEDQIENILSRISSETWVEIQADLRNFGEILHFGSVQVRDGKIITPGVLSLQLVDEQGHWFGNEFNSLFVRGNRHIVESVREMVENISNYLKTQGITPATFGVDFGFVLENGEIVPYVIEVNLGRGTGAGPGIGMMELLGFEDEEKVVRYLIARENVEPNILKAWRRLKESGISFEKSFQRGVMPVVWVAGHRSLLIAGSSEEVSKLEQKALEVLQLKA